MIKRINLLKRQKKYLHVEEIFAKLKIGNIIVIVLLLIVYISFYFVFVQQNRSFGELSAQKEDLLEYFIQNKEVEAKFIYFRSKQKQLSDIIVQDVNFYPYYNLLQESLNIMEDKARLDSVFIDKSKAVNFTVSFNNYSDLVEFLKFAESEDFLNNFTQLSLANFSKNYKQVAKSDYKLNFSGKFIKLNEN